MRKCIAQVLNSLGVQIFFSFPNYLCGINEVVYVRDYIL